MSHIQLNNAFLLFCKIFWEIHRELRFLVKKGVNSERSREIHRQFVFLNMFVNGQILRKIWIYLTTVFDQTSKMGEILTKYSFSPECESHTGNLCFFVVVLKHFREIHREFLFLIQKVTISEKSQSTHKVYFSLQV